MKNEAENANLSEALYGEIRLSPAMRARIDAGEKDEHEVRTATAGLLARLGFGSNAPDDVGINNGNAQRWANYARQGSIDAACNEGSMFRYLLFKDNTEQLLKLLLPGCPNPNEIMENPRDVRQRLHPLEIVLPQPRRLQILLSDPRTDLTMGTGSMYALAERLEAERSDIMNVGKSKNYNRNKAHYITQHLGPLGEAYVAVQAIGLPMPKHCLGKSRKLATRSDKLWRTIERGETPLWDVAEQDMKLLCSRVGASDVFAPHRWTGHETEALEIMQTFHPSLRQTMVREEAALQSGLAISTGWQQRIGKSAGWQR